MAIEPFLRELANEGVPLSRANLRALSKLTPGERDELHAAWPGIAATRRQAIVEQLRLISDSAVDVDFTPVFLRALHDDAPGVRAAAIQALWEYEGRDIIETLATLLATDGEIGVRAAAAEALGRFALLAEHGKLRPPDTSRVDEALRDAATGAATPLEVRARAIEAAGARSEPWVAAIIDEISGRAHMGSDIENPRFMFTGKMEVRYRRNVPIGKMLKVVGRAGRSRGKTAEAWAGIYDAETDELLAEGTALHIEVPEGQFDKSRLSELGWKVYPE